MYNKGKVISGLLIFVALITLPIWKSAFFSAKESSSASEPVILKTAGTECVEGRAFMRANHMVMLNNWRNEDVRENKKVYTNSKGKHFDKSLSGTCLNCHSNKDEFCDSCHKSTGVQLYCFDCHLTGMEKPACPPGSTEACNSGDPHER